MKTITKLVTVGIWDNCTATLRVYDDRTVATIPEVRWVGNTGGYHEGKYRITGDYHREIVACLADGAEESAWQAAHAALNPWR